MKIKIDKSLTPETAEFRQLEWIGDAVYDESAPDVVNQEVEDLIKCGYLVGNPASNATDIYVGVYRPLVSQSETSSS